MVAFWVARVLDGHHDGVSWNFLIVGHTKFSPDQLFGLLKSIFKKHDVVTPEDFAHHSIHSITIDQTGRTRVTRSMQRRSVKVMVCFDPGRGWRNRSEPFLASKSNPWLKFGLMLSLKKVFVRLK